MKNKSINKQDKNWIDGYFIGLEAGSDEGKRKIIAAIKKWLQGKKFNECDKNKIRNFLNILKAKI